MKSDVPKYAPSRRDADNSSARLVIPLTKTNTTRKYFTLLPLCCWSWQELESTKHIFKRLCVHVIKVCIGCLEFDNIAFSLVDDGKDLDTLLCRCAVWTWLTLIIGDGSRPGFSTNRRG